MAIIDDQAVRGIVREETIDMRGEMGAMRLTVDATFERTGELSVEHEELSMSLEQLKADVEDIKIDVAELKTDVAELKVDVTELKVGQRHIFKVLATHDAKFDQITGHLERLEDKFDQVLDSFNTRNNKT